MESRRRVQPARQSETATSPIPVPAALPTVPGRAGALLALQRSLGNRRVQRILSLAQEGGEGELPPAIERSIEGARGGGRPLDAPVRARMESSFGADFGGVRVHTGPQADALNQAVSARAFTTGRDVFFRQGEYDPGSRGGRELLAHELTHVVQQDGAVRGKLTLGPADDPFEREADRVARAVAEERPAGEGETGSAPKALQRKCAGCGGGTPAGAAGAAGDKDEEECPACKAKELRRRAATAAIQRACIASPCPVLSVSLKALFPLWEAAEKCIQETYAREHPASRRGISLSFNADWMALTGAGPAEKAGLDCLKGGETSAAGPNFTAKSARFGGQPDIWDFHERTMMEITTASGAPARVGKLGAQIALANALCAPADCGGLTFDRGTWQPAGPCYSLGNDLFYSVTNNQGVLVYDLVKDLSKEAVLATALAAAAAALKKGGGAAAGKAAGSQVGGKLVPAYAIASLAAAAILLASGKAEAKLGPGSEEPLVQLFQALAAKGTPVPKEIQEAIEADPDLKAKIEKAMSAGGDPSAAQKELNEKILKIIADNKDQFSAEDLETILATTGVAGKALPQGDVTVANVKSMLDKVKAGAPGGGQGQVGGSGTAADKDKTPDAGTGAKAPDKPAAPDAGKGPNAANAADAGKAPDAAKPTTPPALTEAGKKRIAGSPGPVQDLWRAFTSAASGLAADDSDVDRFLALVPADLTADQSAALAAKATGLAGSSKDEVFAALKKAVEEVKKTKAVPVQGDGDPAKDTATLSEDAPDDEAAAKSADDSATVGKLAKVAAKGAPGVAKGDFSLTWYPKKDQTRISGIVRGVTPQGVVYAGWVSADIKPSAGNTVEAHFVASTPMVAKDGTVVFKANKFVGQTQTLTLTSGKGKKK